MNKWQKHFTDTYYNGKTPRDRIGKYLFASLGQVKDSITVCYPNGEETFSVTLNDEDCDMPNGVISVNVLASNLQLWTDRGYKVTTK